MPKRGLDLRLRGRGLVSDSGVTPADSDAVLAYSVSGWTVSVWYAFRNAIGSVQAAKMDDKIARNVAADKRANVIGKRVTSPLTHCSVKQLSTWGIIIPYTTMNKRAANRSRYYAEFPRCSNASTAPTVLSSNLDERKDIRGT